MAEERDQKRLAAILAADVVGFMDTRNHISMIIEM